LEHHCEIALQSAVTESIKLQLTVTNYNYDNTTVTNLMH